MQSFWCHWVVIITALLEFSSVRDESSPVAICTAINRECNKIASISLRAICFTRWGRLMMESKRSALVFHTRKFISLFAPFFCFDFYFLLSNHNYLNTRNLAPVLIHFPGSINIHFHQQCSHCLSRTRTHKKISPVTFACAESLFVRR